MRSVASIVFSLLVLLGCATRPPEYLVSHIMCTSESEASRAIARIRAGEPFERVAEAMSQDPGTRAKGGKIERWTKADDWTANFRTEVRQLKVGEVSDRPVKTEFGWHVVRVDAVR